MTSEYEYLKQYVGNNDLKGNYFLTVIENDVKCAEKNVDKKLPAELKSFYKKIGAGILSCGKKYPEMLADSLNNEILPPLVAAHFYQGIIEHQVEPKEEALHYGENWLALSTLEDLEPGDLPFFEIGDSSRFLIMKMKSDNPNAVWTVSGIKIEDSFERFIWRLYYESPWFYDDIIEDHYKKKSK